ncbi:PREDICTED: retinol dehydrogenase 12-like, partial [Corvus brachyrhynchos]|uniref:retinol dehydrogenase 12-like n=1 Tax=Corvus brachyrhynchos TaxID=85066 RepID=UPI0008167D13
GLVNSTAGNVIAVARWQGGTGDSGVAQGACGSPSCLPQPLCRPSSAPSSSRSKGTHAVPCCRPGKGPAYVTFVPSHIPHPAMELLGTLSPPWWLLLLLLLGLLLWTMRRSPWDPRKCPTDLTGKTVIVTGANSGIGKCVAMDLARRNARTILACRSLCQARPRSPNRAPTPHPNAPRRSPPSFPGLPFAITSEGLEETFATNYLGPFLLTNLLLDLLKASAPARVVNVSSFRHSVGTADSGYLTGQRRPGGYDTAYDSTKLMNVLFTAELARRLQGTGVTTNALSPGVVSTSIMRHSSRTMRVLFNLLRPFMKSAEQGAASTIFCAVSEEGEGNTAEN